MNTAEGNVCCELLDLKAVNVWVDRHLQGWMFKGCTAPQQTQISEIVSARMLHFKCCRLFMCNITVKTELVDNAQKTTDKKGAWGGGVEVRE